MTTPHKHAEVLRAIADGEEVEYQEPHTGVWWNLRTGINPIASPDLKWRIEPKMVHIGRHSWPMPLAEEPLTPCHVWVVCGDGSVSKQSSKGHWAPFWASGFVHLTGEAAKQHAAALRCINRGDVE